MKGTVLLGLLGCLLVHSAGADLVLVEDGRARVPIVVFENAPPFTRQAAADELATYIEKISGARPEVLEGRPDPLPESAIWVGVQPVLKTLFPELDLEFRHPEEILLAANDKHLVIAGRDKWDTEHLEIQLGRKLINGVQQEYGTVNAVYTFLQDHLGVRWLWPGELGEDLEPRATIALAPFEHRYHPQFRARDGAFDIYRLNRQHPGHEWARRQRLQLDSLGIYGGHPFQDWWARFHETHPEYFALQPDGTRGGGAKPWPDATSVKLCKSNPAVWQQWLADVEAELERNPNATVFGAAANDGAYEGYCVCEKCRAWDSPEAPQLMFRWNGLAQQYVSMTDRQITFANHLGRLLKERHPGREYHVMIMAYGNSTHPPVAAVPDDNVLVASVHSFHRAQPVHPRTGVDQRQLFLDYAKKAPGQMIWRPNIGQGSGWHIGTPVVAPRRAIEDMRLVADSHVVGLWIDSIFGHWANQGVHYYILAQLAWNPRADGAAILEDYTRRAYGPAAAAMRGYWEHLEEATLAMTLEGRPEEAVWDAAFHAKANQLLDQAAAELAEAPAKHAQRVAFARAGLEYLRLLQENRALVARWNDSRKQDTAARDAAVANWSTVEAMMKEHHPFLLNPSYIVWKSRRLLGSFYPEDPAPAQ